MTNTRLSETYIDAIDPITGEKIKKKVEDTKMSPDEFSVRFVKDKSYSAQLSLDRRTPGAGIDSYSFDGKIKTGKTKIQFTTLFGNSLGLLPPSFANLDLSEKIGSTRLVVTNSSHVAPPRAT